MRSAGGGSFGQVFPAWIVFGILVLEFSWKCWKYSWFVCLCVFCVSKKIRAEVSRRTLRQMNRNLSYETDSGPTTTTVSDLNFQVTTTTAAATTCQQFSHLARPLDHSAQGLNIPFGVITHFNEIQLYSVCVVPHLDFRAINHTWIDYTVAIGQEFGICAICLRNRCLYTSMDLDINYSIM